MGDQDRDRTGIQIALSQAFNDIMEEASGIHTFVGLKRIVLQLVKFEQRIQNRLGVELICLRSLLMAKNKPLTRGS